MVKCPRNQAENLSLRLLEKGPLRSTAAAGTMLRRLCVEAPDSGGVGWGAVSGGSKGPKTLRKSDWDLFPPR